MAQPAEDLTGSSGNPGNSAKVATSEAPPAAPAVETPSGKNADTENFPVGSFLLPKRLRPHVATFYAFARAIDDIADDSALTSDEKIRRLRGFEAALTEDGAHPGYEKADALRASLRETNVTTKHACDLIAAFIQDAELLRYPTWESLVGYCELSANPVGRYLLDLHGEDPAHYPYSDALCTILQILNHLQDCGDDRRDLDRVYIIGDWLDEEGGRIEELDKASLTPAMRRVMDRMLDGCDGMMADARRLAPSLASKSLAMESAVIVNLAARLTTLLRNGDPLARRVALKRIDFLSAGLRGVMSGFFAGGGRR